MSIRSHRSLVLVRLARGRAMKMVETAVQKFPVSVPVLESTVPVAVTNNFYGNGVAFRLL